MFWHVLSHKYTNHYITSIHPPLYLSFSQYLNTSTEYWDMFFKSYPKVLIAISYDFSIQLLLNKNIYQHPVLFIQPISNITTKIPNDNYNIKLPIIEDSIPLIQKNEFLTIGDIIHNQMRNGYFYLLNYTFPSYLKYTQTKIIKNNFSLGEYGSILNLPDQTLLSFSPENFINITKNQITTEPIKGTLSIKEDKSLLLNNKKENIEQSMIVDLLRNDLGRICNYGSIDLLNFKKIKQQHNLYQMYSTISGTIDSLSFQNILDLLPAGSISGIPKVEVCSFLHKYEKKPRGFYTGIAGYFDFKEQNGFFNILIRMIEIKNNNITLQAGSGITLDSNFENEYNEILTKVDSVKQYINSLVY